MRIIKFRAWDHTHSRMVYDDDTGSVSCTNSKLNVTIPAWIECDGTNWQSWPLPNHELMQFTGLRDRNGKEIYESDIVITDWQHDGVTCVDYTLTGKMIWNEEDSCFSLEHSDGIIRYLATYEREELMGIEVIGNIHENPELLNQQP